MKTETISVPAGPLQILTIAFVVLKLCHIISWSWWWVLSPLLIPLGICGAIMAVCGVLIIVAHMAK